MLMRNTGSGHIQAAIREQVRVCGCHLLGKKQAAKWRGQGMTISQRPQGLMSTTNVQL